MRQATAEMVVRPRSGPLFGWLAAVVDCHSLPQLDKVRLSQSSRR